MIFVLKKVVYIGFSVINHQFHPSPTPGAVRQSLVKMAMVRVDAPHVVQKDVGFPGSKYLPYLTNKLFPSNPQFGISNMGVSKNRGTPKWMVKIMENPMNIMDDLGGPPLFLETPIY